MSKIKIILFTLVTIIAGIRGMQFHYEEGPILGPILFVVFNWALFFLAFWIFSKVARLFAK